MHLLKLGFLFLTLSIPNPSKNSPCLIVSRVSLLGELRSQDFDKREAALNLIFQSSDPQLVKFLIPQVFESVSFDDYLAIELDPQKEFQEALRFKSETGKRSARGYVILFQTKLADFYAALEKRSQESNTESEAWREVFFELRYYKRKFEAKLFRELKQRDRYEDSYYDLKEKWRMYLKFEFKTFDSMKVIAELDAIKRIISLDSRAKPLLILIDYIRQSIEDSQISDSKFSSNIEEAIANADRSNSLARHLVAPRLKTILDQIQISKQNLQRQIKRSFVTLDDFMLVFEEELTEQDHELAGKISRVRQLLVENAIRDKVDDLAIAIVYDDVAGARKKLENLSAQTFLAHWSKLISFSGSAEMDAVLTTKLKALLN